MVHYEVDPNYPSEKDGGNYNKELRTATTADSSVGSTSATQDTGVENYTVASAPVKEVPDEGSNCGSCANSSQ